MLIPTRKLIVITFLSLTLTQPTHSEAVNYCTDPEINQEWERLIKKNGYHPEWRTIYKLRKELCSSVDSGTITLEDAVEQFEIHRAIMIEKLRERIEKVHGKQTGTA